MYYVFIKGGWRSKNDDFLLCLVLKVNTKGREGGQKTPKHDYVIHGWSRPSLAQGNVFQNLISVVLRLFRIIE